MEKSLAYGFGYTSISLITVLLIKAVISVGSHDTSYAIWHFLSWIHYIKWAGLMKSEGPKSFYEFYQKLIQVFKPDPMNTFSPPCSVPDQFKLMGFDYSYFLNNSEVPMIIWGFFGVIYLFFLFFKVRSLERIRKSVCDNLIIRATLVFFMDFFLYASLQIRQFEISTVYGIINSVISLVIISCLLIFWAFVSAVVLVKTEEPTYLQRIKTLRQEFDVSHKKYLLYYFLFIFERLVTSISYVFLQDYPEVQCFIVETAIGVVCNDYLVIYVTFVKPFRKKFLNVFVMILEAFSIIILGLIGSFSLDGVSDKSKENMFFMIVSVLFLSIPVFLFITFKVGETTAGSSVGTLNNQNNNQVLSTVNETKIENNIKIAKNQKNDEDIQGFSRKHDESRFRSTQISYLDSGTGNDHILNSHRIPKNSEHHGDINEEYQTKDNVGKNTNWMNEKSVESRITFYSTLYEKYLKK